MSEKLETQSSSPSLLLEAHRGLQSKLKALESQIAKIAARGTGKHQLFHKTRVLTRKIQASTFAFKTLIPKKLRSKINDEIRNIRRNAGVVRDRDVAIEILDEALAIESQPFTLAAGAVREELVSQREKALGSFQKVCESSGESGIWNKVRRQLNGELLEKKDERSHVGLVEYGMYSIQSAWNDVLECHRYFENSGETDEDLHLLRKKVKRFRYTVELFPLSIDGNDRKTILEACKKVQDALGGITDTLILRTMTCRFEIEMRRGNVDLRQSFTHLHQWLDEREFTYRDRFRSVWHRYFIPVAHFTERTSWPHPVQETFATIPEDLLN